MPIVAYFFADVDDPQVHSEKCPESNTTIGSVEKKNFRLNGLKRGTRKRKGESGRQYRARRVFSDMVSAGLSYLGKHDGEMDPFVLEIWIGLEADKLNEQIGRTVSSDQKWYESKKAAREALRIWDPETARKIKATASKAGSTTKWTLEDYLETRDMTVAQALRYLTAMKGIKSRTTVYEMRKHYDALNVETGELK